MTKTEHYQLNKPEATDPVRVADFNANADIIDGALAGKAEQSAVAALQSAVNGKGNCRIMWGSYTGNGTCGSSNPVTLNTSFYPVVVLCGTPDNVTTGHWPTILMRGVTTGVCDYNAATMTVTWTDNAVSWYNKESDYAQNNDDGVVYYYLVLGYSE